MRRIILFLLILSSINCQESAQYLQNTVRDLRRLNYRQTLRRADTIMAQSAPRQGTPQQVQIPERRAHHGPSEIAVAPTLTLTKGELAALYENAIAKGETLKLDTGENTFIHAAVHELDDHHGHHEHHDHHDHHHQHQHPDQGRPDSYHDHHDHPSDAEASNHNDGYYYYYYPVKSFMDEIASGSSTSENKKPWAHPPTTHAPPYQYHSHHHEVTIKKENEMKDKKEKKGLEPLFMAISGFVGMAVMFVFSMLIFPKFTSKPKKSSFWHKSTDMDELARLALNAIEGKDCRERFACELSKGARNFHLQENRFIKLLKRIAPGTFGSQLDRIGKYGDRQLKCTLIPCTKKIIKIQKIINKKTPLKKKNVAQKKH